MRELEMAADYLARQGLRCVDMLELLRRDSGSVRYAGRDGLLLWDKESGAWFLSARSEADLNRALALIPQEARLATCHEDWYLDAVERHLGLKGRAFFQSVWTKEEPPELPPFQGELRRLGPEWAERVAEAYCQTFGDVDYILGAIDRGMLGLFDGESLAGFIGVHDEGSLGMLEAEDTVWCSSWPSSGRLWRRGVMPTDRWRSTMPPPWPSSKRRE